MTLIFCLRIVIACICGGVIGLERTKRLKEAGIRTHIIIALGSAVMMIISKYAFMDLVIYQNVNMDGSRIAANIITGISFLGAGAIFLRKNRSIRGLTTAAGMWATTAVGMSVGSGMYIIGIFATIMIVVVQFCMHKWCRNLEMDIYQLNETDITVHCTSEGLATIHNAIDSAGMHVNSCEISPKAKNIYRIRMNIGLHSHTFDEMLKIIENTGVMITEADIIQPKQ
ncbi:MAG: MgtC/SapB family protein [Clostridia bacterium]|nr:MgtC/SapB family protein [Clostridia bacterium]